MAAAFTSQDCSPCGERVRKSLAIREHRCIGCGLVVHRDHNAAINIQARTAPCASATTKESSRFCVRSVNIIAAEIEMVKERDQTLSRTVYLGLGSNLGDREANICEAVRRIKKLGLTITRLSPLYETEPVGYLDQDWFLNQVIEASYAADSKFRAAAAQSDSFISQTGQLLYTLLEIEREMGRLRHIPDGPRKIDIDVLIYRDMKIIIEEKDLIVPHPRMHLRRFVLVPLCDIAPDLLHPVLKRSCREILDSLKDRSIVRPYIRPTI